MTALTSVFISQTSLLGFSRALNVISDNVANLNTIGFKGADLYFQSLPSTPAGLQDLREAAGSDVIGAGTRVAGGARRFAAGEIRETGTNTHLAIDGEGFFLVELGHERWLTRSGQFQLNDQGRLIDADSGGRVMAISDSGIEPLAINLRASNPPSPTTTVSFRGNLSTGDTAHSIGPVTLYDSDGVAQTYTLDFTKVENAAQSSWTVSVKNSTGQEVRTGEIRFEGSGSPTSGYNSFDLELTAGDGTKTVVALSFGTPGAFDGATSFSGGTESTLQSGTIDGYTRGQLTSFAFDEDGLVTLTFSNGQTEEGPRLVLASVADPQRLQSADGVRYIAPDDLAVTYGRPGDGAHGAVASGSLELANVDLAREFGDIIILQRGFQASSQILNVSSEMIQDLYNSLSGRG